MAASEAAVAAAQKALLDEGAGPGTSIHSWRCEYPDRYGPCDCVAEVARAVADAAVDADRASIQADALREWALNACMAPVNAAATFTGRQMGKTLLARADRIEGKP